MRLNQDVREALLQHNDGFETSTYYSAKNISDTRDYKIVDGQLHVRSRGKTSWADSRFDQSWVADDKATHRFLYEHLDALDADGVPETAAALGAERRASRAAHAAAAEPAPFAVERRVGDVDGVAVPLGSSAARGQGVTSDRSVDANRVVFWAGVALAVVPAAVAAAPHVPRLWREQVTPRAARLRNRFTKTSPVETATGDE